MGPEVVWVSQVEKNPGDAVVAAENKHPSRRGAAEDPRTAALTCSDADDAEAPDERMNADQDGCSRTGLGQEPSRDLHRGSAQSLNSPRASPRRANSIKVELCSEDESHHDGVSDPTRDERVMEEGQFVEGLCSTTSAPPARIPSGKLQCEVCGMTCIGPNVLMVHKRSHTGERPFHCNQCGASFTQKGNLLRHIKLHSGEKPFKCPVCTYACRRRDALAGHLRTHAVSSPSMGKPFKCSFCSRGYKLQGALEEHKQRCHIYLKEQRAGVPGPEPGDEATETTRPAGPPSFVDRLASSLTKRKRSTPQKISAETDLNLHEAPYELSSGSEADHMSSQHSGDSTGLVSRHGPAHPAFMSEFRSAVTSVNRPPSTVGHEGGGDDPSALSHIPSPNGCPDSTDTESTPDEPSTRALVLTSTSNNHQTLTPAHHHHHLASRLVHTKYLDPDWARACVAPPPAAVRRISGSPSSSRVQVLDGDGQAVRSFHCHHCRILFLDHVMFTIHMGCHGFRQPFECNICGHRSRDRYEFSSHISRGQHQVG